MTIWNPTVAGNVYRRLADVNSYVARATFLLQQDQFDTAIEAVSRAIAAKLAAVESFPDLDVPGDRLGLPFRDVYDLLVRVWFIVAPIAERTRLLRDDFFIDPDAAVRLLRSEIARVRQFRDRNWPGDSDCRERLTELINALEAVVAGVDARLAAMAFENVFREQDRACFGFLECLEPESQISLSFAYWSLFETDLALVRAYDELLHPVRPLESTAVRRERVLSHLQNPILKEELMKHFRDKFPGIEQPLTSPDWSPAPDPLPPWPPRNAG
jgi:hypothetical protein